MVRPEDLHHHDGGGYAPLRACAGSHADHHAAAGCRTVSRAMQRTRDTDHLVRVESGGGLMVEVPMIAYWKGRRVDELTREELIEAVTELGNLYAGHLE